MFTIKNRRRQIDNVFYYPINDNWWLDSFIINNQSNWTFVDNTNKPPCFLGHEIDKAITFWIGVFNGDRRSHV